MTVVFRGNMSKRFCQVMILLLLSLLHTVHVFAEPASIVDFGPFSTKLSSEDLGHGEKQLENAIHDRPLMEKYVTKGGPIWNWVVRQFAGEYTGARTYWRSRFTPVVGEKNSWKLGGYCTPPRNGEPGIITVADMIEGRSLTGDQQWSHLIFECYNIRNGHPYEEYESKAAHAQLTKEQFVREVAGMEYDAMIKRSVFYEKHWLPAMKEMGGFTSDPGDWGIPLPPTFDQWIARYTDHSRYPWETYGKLYDKIVIRNKIPENWPQPNFEHRRMLMTY